MHVNFNQFNHIYSMEIKDFWNTIQKNKNKKLFLVVYHSKWFVQGTGYNHDYDFLLV